MKKALAIIFCISCFPGNVINAQASFALSTVVGKNTRIIQTDGKCLELDRNGKWKELSRTVNIPIEGKYYDSGDHLYMTVERKSKGFAVTTYQGVELQVVVSCDSLVVSHEPWGFLALCFFIFDNSGFHGLCTSDSKMQRYIRKD
mgnify:CR=1 FL=1